MFNTVLIANRGEIALRVIRTCRRLGIRTVAVYSDADAQAAHVKAADTAVHLGPAQASESYLRIDKVIAAAKTTGAEAIHPGYGFLSENADFSAACESEGIVFLGPGAEAIRTMGDKITAKNAVSQRGVPLVPGTKDAAMSNESLVTAADDIGFPVLIKPSAGGGGKGMHAVFEPSELATALDTARREAASSFGDDTLFLERLVATPRHIEVQIMADAHGNVIHLGERECSLQRRHQKVIEEAPSALLDEATRARIGQAACETAKSVGYRGAGTVEFIVGADRPDEFFFMEMNTRLQVEHPVTEEVTGIDLVELQLRVGAGEELPLSQDDITMTGHSIEARIYAEDPSRGFLPTGGRALDVVFPEGEGIRIDAGLDAGQTIASDYDPMIAKLIVHAPDRAAAIARLDAALAASAVPGIVTNIDFLRTLMGLDEVVSGNLDTSLIDRLGEDQLAHAPGDLDRQLAATAVLVTGGRAGTELTGALTAAHLPQNSATASAWGRPSAWRTSRPDFRPSVALTSGGENVDVEAQVDDVTIDDDGLWHLTIDGVQTTARVFSDARDRSIWVSSDRGVFVFTRSQADTSLTPGLDGAEVLAPMPGSVVAVRVESGDHVDQGDPIVVVEAMKMEHVLTAPAAGIVTVTAVQGAQVGLDEVLATVVDEAAAEAADSAAADTAN
ncbi:acetyl-CoA carboxylase biotin carboxylase subunit [Brevibacterium aurantiacum]|uniref:biotin carboxylase n=1 Tax=Brevibacterium aurantiacum TaxID=273384 RepID=A0A2H1JLX7_BREAU|nr:acetyl-CoA carboxylase biotin carboxylase subunit [Brevibacterium aurantiacum]GEB21913.1 acetyl-/propionyl-coenzyme A carboxylase alpha chain [Brevibacterium aurantiacum]SMX88354.1 acetyl-CoA/propionyl-CoA carboxylase, biotin carboxylase, biotin carboxyl carrier protein [Brevibacterium aurantiacum]